MDGAVCLWIPCFDVHFGSPWVSTVENLKWGIGQCPLQLQGKYKEGGVVADSRHVFHGALFPGAKWKNESGILVYSFSLSLSITLSHFLVKFSLRIFGRSTRSCERRPIAVIFYTSLRLESIACATYSGESAECAYLRTCYLTKNVSQFVHTHFVGATLGHVWSRPTLCIDVKL